MKKSKKILLLLTLLLLAMNFTHVRAATTDTEPPVLKDISVKEAKGFKYGERIYLNLDVYEDVSGISKIHLMTTMPENFSTSNAYGWESMKVYFDENNNPYTVFPTSYYKSKYYVTTVVLEDNSGNRAEYNLNVPIEYYIQRDDEENHIYAFNKTIELYLDDGEEWHEEYPDDITPPSISNFKCDKDKAEYNETITCTLTATDDNSGVRDDLYASFVSYDSDEVKTFNMFFKRTTGDNYVANYTVTAAGGKYSLYYVNAWDLAGNNIFYYPNSDDKTDIEILKNDNIVIVQKETNIKNINISKTEFKIPSYVEIELELESNSELEDLAYVTFKGENNTVVAILNKKEGNTFAGELEMNQYLKAGKYELYEVSVLYAEGHAEIFSNREAKGSFTDPTKPLDIDMTITISEGKKADVTTGTSASDLIEKIENAADNSVIYIDATNNSIVKKEVFEAIKDTNKEIHIEAAGIEWTFSGKDIVNPKDIDTSLDIRYDYDYSEENINDYVEKALMLVFKDNGELPGVATIQIKLDYALRNYIGENIYVYYFDNDNNEFTPVIDGEINANDSGYFEFKITHNSTYVFTNQKPKEEYIKETDSITKLNKEYQKEKTADDEDNKENKDNILLIIGIISIVVLVLVLIVLLFNKKKEEKETSKPDNNNDK